MSKKIDAFIFSDHTADSLNYSLAAASNTISHYHAGGHSYKQVNNFLELLTDETNRERTEVIVKSHGVLCRYDEINKQWSIVDIVDSHLIAAKIQLELNEVYKTLNTPLGKALYE